MADKNPPPAATPEQVQALIAQNAELLDRVAKLEEGKAAVATPERDFSVPTQVRVLSDCSYGKGNDVVTLRGNDLKSALETGQADAHPDAVAYAKTLKA